MNKDLQKRLASLSPEKREILLKKLRSKKPDQSGNRKISKRPDQDSYPMSFAQQRMWFHNQLAPDTSLNNIPSAIRLKGSLNIRALEKSLNEIVRRHEVLRATFVTKNGVPHQVMNPELKIDLPIVDLQHIAQHDREQKAKQMAREEALLPFDLAKGPLVRAKLFRLQPDDHIIVLALHHIISDGWSTGVLVMEVAKLYESFLNDKPFPLPELPIQYADFAHWQQQYLQGDVLKKMLDYWKNQLADSPPMLELPTDRPRPTAPVFYGAHLRFQLSKKISDGLKAISREQEATLFMTLLAAFKILLHRYTGQEDICVGSPIANRDQAETEGLIGFFVNVLVMRTQLNDNATFRELLNRVRQVAMDAYAHQALPFERIVEELKISRDISYNPLVQVLFDVQNAPRDELKLPGLTLKPVGLQSGTVKFDLVLSIEDGAQKIDGVLGYNKVLFEESTAQRMVDHFKILLESIVANPDQPISALQILSGTQRQQLTVDWNRTEIEYGPEKNQCIHQLFERQADLTPDQVALIFASQGRGMKVEPGTGIRELETLTYRELNHRANQLAHYLRKQGVTADTLVAFCPDRSIDMIVGLLGILKAGGAYVPIDPTYPAERIEFILKDAGISIVVTHHQYTGRFKNDDLKIVCLDKDWELISQEREKNLSGVVTNDNLAYMIYTSGSTGKPKGVMVPHQGLVNHALTLIKTYELTAEDRILEFISLTFDASAEEIYPALVGGAALVIVRSPAELTGNDMLDLINDQKISILHLPAAVWHNWQDHLERNRIAIPEHLRILFVGGESPSVDKLNSMKKLARHNFQFFNVYGPTEATITSTYFKIDNSSDEPFNDVIPIGRPISNSKVYLLDKNLNPVPIGVPGEMYIAGSGITRGYFNRPDTTAENFVPDPFSNQPGARLYKTGDLARYQPDGNIVFWGRVDFQVKVRGFRIELGEIESAISRHETVKQVAVLVREDTPGGKRIVAYLIFDEQKTSSIDELREFIRVRLPEYMMPSAFITLDEMPLTPHGKIDRHALPAPDSDRSDLGKEFIAPRDELEEFLAKMWREILGIEKIGIHDNFFELGGNSILGATFVNRLQDEIGEYVYLIAIFDAPTIAQMSDYLKKDYPKTASKILGIEIKAEPTEIQRIDQVKVEYLRNLIVSLPPRADDNGKLETKNPPAIFLLSAPRSGSTLFRVMMGGNPKIFAPPELQLLNYNTLEDQKVALGSERDEFWLDGSIRAIMALKDCDADAAKRIMADCFDKKLTVKQFYRLMQDWLGDRIFFDKTPNYSLDLNTIKRAEQDFEDALFIHLIRHPYGVIPSFEKAKLHVFYPPFFKAEHHLSPRELAELVWVITHQNILEFLGSIPEQRQFRVRYEDLVKNPQPIIEDICRFLKVDFHPAMLEPQKDKKKKMTDAIHPLAKMLGDVRFFEHKGINAKRADHWKDKIEQDYLGDITWDLVEYFGYEKRPKQKIVKTIPKKELIPIQPISREGELPLSFGQQRLWFLDQMEPGTTQYNMPVALRAIGELNVPVLKKCINEIIKRHEILRTSFATVEGKATQVIARKVELKISLTDLSALSNERKQSKADQLVRNETQRPFDLSQCPLIRASVIKLAEQEHVVLLTMHHIISDGWSLGILVHEIAALYNAFLKGKACPLPELTIQYADYADWQRQWLRDDAMASQLNYWKQQLADSPPILELPIDRPRPAVQSYNGTSQLFELTTDLYDGIKSLSQQQGVTMFMTLLAAFQTLLYRYSNQENISIGTPIAGRNRAEIEQLIGFFVNTLVIRTDLSGDPSFNELLKRVRQVTTSAFANQDVPFDLLVDTIQPERDMSHSPLFQAMFALQNIELEDIRLTGLTFSPIKNDSGTAKFDLTLTMNERDGRLSGVMEYNTDLFDDSTIERMINHFRRLIAGILENPDQPISRVQILSEDECQTQLVEWNESQVDYSVEQCVHQFIESQAEKKQSEIALVLDNQQLNYQQLNQQANQIANYLIQLGTKPGDPVGLCVERSFDMIAGILGIFKSGAIFVPLDPNYPTERLQYMIEDSALKLILTKQRMSGVLPQNQANLVLLDTDQEKIALASLENPTSRVAPENSAYIIYTSGSTGKPKGVMISHSAISSHCRRMIDYYELKPGDRVLQFAVINFDASLEQIFPALMVGARLVLRGNDLWQASEIYQKIEQFGLTVVNFPTAYWQQLAQAWQETPHNVPADQLRLVIVGGDLMSHSGIKTWQRTRMNEIRLINAYGPTETTITATAFDVPSDYSRAVKRASVPIGRPLPGNQTYVLNRQLNPVPVGASGELFIAGNHLAYGYLNQPNLTAEKFLPNPFSDEANARMYATGDLVRYLPNGNIEFLGRIDHQVKVRGFRIELGEIEAALSKFESIKDVIAIVREDQPGDKRLVSYFTHTGETAPTISEIRNFLKDQLPEYMIPSAFVALDDMPLTPGGKVDRKALPAPDLSRPELRGEYIGPRTEQEKILADIWAQVLRVKQVGVNDNFFELGGDSILTIQVIAKAKQAGLLLNPKQLFQYPTVAALAEVAGSVTITEAEQGPVTGEIPLTPIQQVFFEHDYPLMDHYNQSIMLEVQERLDIEKFKSAIQILMNHHDALRMRYEKTESGWNQVNEAEPQNIPFELFDLSKVPVSRQKSHLEAEATKVQQSLAITEGKLIQFVYFDLGEGRSARLLIVIHHLVIDGVSWRILLEDLYTVYQQLTEDRTPKLPLKTTSFKQWSFRLSEYGRGSELEQEFDFWDEVTSKASIQLPVDFSDGTNLEKDAEKVIVTLDEQQTRALLQEVPPVYGTEINDILLTAVTMAFSQWTGETSLMVDLEGHGREDLFEDIDISRTIGWFTSLFPIHLNLGPGCQIGDWIKTIKEQLHRIPNHGIGYGLLRYLSNKPDVIARLKSRPLAEVSFNYLGQFGDMETESTPFKVANESSGIERSLENQRTHIISINGSIFEGQLRMVWSYSKKLHFRKTIEEIANNFSRSLNTIIEHCQSQQAGGYTPSDFKDVELDQHQIDELMEELSQV